VRGLGAARLLCLSRLLGPPYRNATRSAVSPRRRDDCIAPAMRKPDRTKLPTVAALLLSSDLRLLVRHDLDRLGHPGRVIAFATFRALD
jgi:hypothetical protein